MTTKFTQQKNATQDVIVSKFALLFTASLFVPYATLMAFSSFGASVFSYAVIFLGLSLLFKAFRASESFIVSFIEVVLFLATIVCVFA